MVRKTPFKNNSVLELHVPDFVELKKYYTKMSFKILWERPPEGFKGYIVFKLEENILCFWNGTESVYKQDYFKKWPKKTKRGYGVEIVIMVKDIEKYYGKVKKFANVYEPLKLQPWGLKDFRVEDPFGYYLRFTSKHDISDPENAVE